MRFYEIKAEALKENPVESMSEVNEKAMEEGLKYSERRTARDHAADVSLKTERFNQKYDGAAEVFGNGRYVRNLLEKSRMNQASRLLQKNVDEITREDLSVIEAEDIETPALSGKKEERTIGFMY